MNNVTTVITDSSGGGWVFYDGDCRLCVALAGRWERALARRSFRLAPLQAGWVRARLDLPGEELRREMRVLTPDGKVWGGADALVELSRGFWWARWLVRVAQGPSGLTMLRSAYRWMAARRHCGTAVCAVESRLAANANPPPHRQSNGRRRGAAAAGSVFRAAAKGFMVPRRGRGLDVLPLLALPAAAACAMWNAPAWLLMWSLAGALFLGLKWLTWRDGAAGSAGVWRSVGFFALWPGMEARRFLANVPCGLHAGPAEWSAALFKMALGGVTVWGVTRLAYGASPWLAGWVGMIGLALCLHFGLFHLLSLAWRAAGVDAPPIMDAPLRATALAGFWGRRWNLGFSVPARRFLLKPLAARVGDAGATLGVFLVSGILHELVISVPAGAGYGLPTAYFAVQGVATLVERSAPGRRLGLGAGWRGWLFLFLCTAVPAFWLFHPPFIHRVILPFLQTIGAL